MAASKENNKSNLSITHVDAVENYLRISGTTSPEALELLQQKIQSFLLNYTAIDPTWPLERHELCVQKDLVCLYKSVNSGTTPNPESEFMRARILRTTGVTSGPRKSLKVEVDFIDYGYTKEVRSYELFIPNQSELLKKIPPLSNDYILLGICGDWSNEKLNEIRNIIKGNKVEITIVYELYERKFIKIKWKGFDFVEFLILHLNLGAAPLSDELLLESFKEMGGEQKQRHSNGSSIISTFAPSSISSSPSSLKATLNNNNNYSNMNKNFLNTKLAAMEANQKAFQKPIIAATTPAPLIMPTMATAQTNLTTVGLMDNELSQYQKKSVSARLKNIQISPPRHPVPAFMGSPAFTRGLMMPGARVPHTGRFAGPNIPNNQTVNLAAYYTAAVLRHRAPQYSSVPNVRFTPQQALQSFHLPLKTPANPVGFLNPALAKRTALAAALVPGLNTRSITPLKSVVPVNAAGAAAGVAAPTNPLRSTTYKTHILTIGQHYDVHVSYVDNGPLLFSVQLQSLQDRLCKMMNTIEKEEYNLKRLPISPNRTHIGACIARYSEDNHLYRALIVNVQMHACKVVYVDYGNSELVKFHNLYEIPDKFLEEKAFAIPFCLSKSKSLEPIDDSMKKAFTDRVLFKPCRLKVVPLEGPPVVQYCELNQQNEDMVQMLKVFQSKRNVYPKAENLTDSDVVEIRYIDSPKRFFVQKTSNISKFHKLMDEMFAYYNANQIVPKQLQLGDPCIVKCENDWYRGEVLRDDDTAIVIRHVDFGYEQKVTRNLLSVINPKHLKMPRQAVQCCLKGFENTDFKKDLAATQFEMLAEDSEFQRREFSVKIFRIEPNGVNLVNLYTKELNLMKKLYKMSMPFEEYVSLEKSEFNFSKKASLSSARNAPKTPSINNSIAGQSDNDKSRASSVNSKQDKIKPTPAKQTNNTQQQNKSPNEKPNHNQKQTQPQPQTQSQTQPQQQQQQLQTQKPQQSQSPGHHSQRASNKGSQSPRNNKENIGQGQQNEGRKGKTSNQGPSPQPQQQQQQHQFKKPAPVAANAASSSDNTSLNSSLSAKSQKTNKSQAAASRSPRHSNRQQRESQRGLQKLRNTPQGYSHSPCNTSIASSKLDTSSQSSNGSKPVKSSTPHKRSEEYIPAEQAFPRQDIQIPTTSSVDLSWWVSPHQFYVQKKDTKAEFKELNQQMQLFYKNKPCEALKLKVNSSIIILNRQDKTFYRAQILGMNLMLKKYKVLCVDEGRQLLVSSEDIWPVEKRFASFPCLAYECSFKGIVCNFDHLHIIRIMKHYLPVNSEIVCDFYERYNSAYYVNVRISKLCLKEKFIANNILWPVDPDLCLDLLAGQQIRAKFTTITDMLNFKIKVEGCDPNIHFICSYDDVRFVRSNPHINDQFKDFYSDKSFVVNIKSVNEHKVLFLRPLVPLFKDDVPTYIPTYPIVLKSFHAQLLYVASPYRFYIVCLDEVERLKKLYLDMIDFYAHQGESLKKVEKDMICAAQGKDGRWHRCRVKSVLDKGDKVEVFFLDHGDIEQFRKSQLKVLDERFYSTYGSALAIEVNLPIRTNVDLLHSSKKTTDTKTENDIKIEKALQAHLFKPNILVQVKEMRHNRLIGDVELESGSIVDLLEKEKLIMGRDMDYIRKVLDKEKSNVWSYIETVDLTLDDEDEDCNNNNTSHRSSSSSSSTKSGARSKSAKTKPLTNGTKETTKLEKLEALPVAELPKELEIQIPEANNLEISSSTPTNVSEGKATPKSVDNPYADMEQAVLSHCDNPANFYVHLQHRLDELYKLQENLQIVARSLPPLMCVVNGASCIALYSVSDQWCRAKILDAELLVLRYTDFGNTDWISDPTDIKEMSVFPDIEPFCIPCALPIRPNGTADWVDAANAIFNDSFYKKLYFEYITRGDFVKKSYINLYIDGVNVAEKLIENGFAKPLVLVDSNESCYISHMNNISDFYIQYEKNSKGLELIECYLAQADNLKPLREFEQGKIVAALFPDDEMWYRAQLIKALPNNGGFEVLFIDYGNTSVSAECREISEDIASLPPLSTKCCLHLPEDCLAWSEAAEEKFAEISATGETIFTIELVEPGNDYAIVQLFIDDSNVNEDLKVLCEMKLVEGSEPELDLNASFANTTLQTTIYDPDTLYEALVYHVNALDDFYIQFEKNSERLSDINCSLNSLALDNLKNVEVGQMCATIFEEDGLLYRARIVEILSEAPKLKCRCLLVDYGNEVETEIFKALPQDLMEIQHLAKQCQLACAELYRDQPTAKEALDLFYKLLEESKFTVQLSITNHEVEPLVVRLLNKKHEDLEEKLQQLLAEQQKKELKIDLPFRRCVVSHTIAPDHFYLQMMDNSDQMELIAKQLSKSLLKDNQPLEHRSEVKDWCYVYSSEDDCYYRGQIEAIEANNSYKVFLLDYGNSLVTDKIYQLPEDLQIIAPLARKCCLLDFDGEAYSSSQLLEAFNDLLESHFGEIFEVVEDVYDEDKQIHKVRLQVNYKDLTKELIASLTKENGNEKSIIPVLHNCHIVYSQSPQTFFIHYEKDLQAIEDLRNALNDIEKNSNAEAHNLEHIKEGSLVAAYSEDFAEFYRAKVLSHITDTKYAVHFIDYGNDSCSDKLLPLPDNLLELNSYATYCSLGNDIHVTSSDFKEQFLEFISSRYGETFQIEFINTDSKPFICRLFYQNKDLSQELNEIIKTKLTQDPNDDHSETKEDDDEPDIDIDRSLSTNEPTDTDKDRTADETTNDVSTDITNDTTNDISNMSSKDILSVTDSSDALNKSLENGVVSDTS